MIAQITGKLISLDEQSGLIQVGPICYEVMLPGYAVSALAGRIGQEVALCTMEYYEGTLGGNNSYPADGRLLSQADATSSSGTRA